MKEHLERTGGRVSILVSHKQDKAPIFRFLFVLDSFGLAEEMLDDYEFIEYDVIELT